MTLASGELQRDALVHAGMKQLPMYFHGTTASTSMFLASCIGSQSLFGGVFRLSAGTPIFAPLLGGGSLIVAAVCADFASRVAISSYMTSRNEKTQTNDFQRMKKTVAGSRPSRKSIYSPSEPPPLNSKSTKYKRRGKDKLTSNPFSPP